MYTQDKWKTKKKKKKKLRKKLLMEISIFVYIQLVKGYV
jgi:hypothetical protein